MDNYLIGTIALLVCVIAGVMAMYVTLRLNMKNHTVPRPLPKTLYVQHGKGIEFWRVLEANGDKLKVRSTKGQVMEIMGLRDAI